MDKKNILQLSYLIVSIKVIRRLPGGIQFSSVAQLCPTLCDPMDCSMPGLPVHHQLPEFTQTHVHCLENPTDRGAWKAAAHGVAKSQT